MDLSFENGYSLSEASDILLNEDTEGDIFIEPPNPHVDTDVNSADEDGSGLVNNLSSRQLLANAEIRLQNNERLGVIFEDFDSPHNISQVHTTSETSLIVGPIHLSDKDKKCMSTRIKAKRKPCWMKEADIDVEKTNVFPDPDYSIYQNISIIEIFEKFIDDEIIQHFEVETKNYALFLNCSDPNITTNEIRCFLAILYASGYNDLPCKRHYWDNGDDMKNIAVSQSISRDRFLQICRFFHCANNTEMNENDKGWKILPFIEMMKKSCINNFVPEEHLAYDENMVKYFGRHSCKQFIRGKSLRFKYKIWSLNSKDGYLVNFILYPGKNLKSNFDYEKLFGKAASLLLVLLNEIPDDKRKLKYNIFMDNLFSFLRFREYSAIDTIRDNGIPKNCPLTNKTIFKKKKIVDILRLLWRGKMDYCIYVGWTMPSLQ